MTFFGQRDSVPGFSRFSQNITEAIVDSASGIDRFAQRDGQKVGAALTKGLEGVEKVGTGISAGAGAVLPGKFCGDALKSGAKPGLSVQGALKALDTEGRYSQTGTRGGGLQRAKEYAPKIAAQAGLTAANIEAAAVTSLAFL